MKEILNEWIRQKVWVEININTYILEAKIGIIKRVDEKYIYYVEKDSCIEAVIPWEKIIYIKENKSFSIEEKLDIVNIYYIGPYRIMSHGFLVGVNEEFAVTKYFDGMKLHPMKSIKICYCS